jgi:uncharacterized phage protein gp47/JayE
VSFLERPYPDVVRDMLTTLTKGVVQESHLVSYDPQARPLAVPDIVLQQRPVVRVSFVSGYVSAGPDAALVATVFSLNDYELVPDAKDPAALNTIRFLPFGRKPAPGTNVVVNYYPRTAEPAPVTDLNVGSVVRTLLESVSREIAMLYAQLNLVYDAGFVETASGASLDRVAALVGITRYPAGYAVGAVTLTRSPSAIGDITIPAGTPITDTKDQIRYETAETHEMRAGEDAAQIRIRGSSTSTPPVDAGILTVLQRVIAGVSSAINQRPTTLSSSAETDDDLRARARSALIGADKGTVEAITYGLLELPQVRDAKVIEMPYGVPGEIKILISRADGLDAKAPLPMEVLERIEQLRPAGIRIVSEVSQPVELSASVHLTLAGSSLPPADLDSVHTGVQRSLITAIQQKGVGERIRVKPLVAALLGDKRIVDAEITLSTLNGPAGNANADFDAPEGTAVSISAHNIAFVADTFEQAPPPGTAAAVEVTARIAAQLIAGIALDAAKEAIQSKLAHFFASPPPSIDSQAILNTLRDDTKYTIDPLRTKVTFASGGQFAEVAQGTGRYTVAAGQTFTVMPIEVDT